jgi:hypothetical protein
VIPITPVRKRKSYRQEKQSLYEQVAVVNHITTLLSMRKPLSNERSIKLTGAMPTE